MSNERPPATRLCGCPGADAIRPTPGRRHASCCGAPRCRVSGRACGTEVYWISVLLSRVSSSANASGHGTALHWGVPGGSDPMLRVLSVLSCTKGRPCDRSAFSGAWISSPNCEFQFLRRECSGVWAHPLADVPSVAVCRSHLYQCLGKERWVPRADLSHPVANVQEASRDAWGLGLPFFFSFQDPQGAVTQGPGKQAEGFCCSVRLWHC